jgi:poly(3-hydroxybutyrate) depolymerase
MSPRRLSVVVAAMGAVCLIATGLAAQPPAKKEPGKGTLSRVEKKTYEFKEAGKEMEYALFVPSKYAKDKKSPLIVALHGLGGTPQSFMRFRGFTDLAEKHGYIVAAPMGYNERGWYGARMPAKGKGKKTEPENLSELSEKDVMNVLEIVKKDYSIDPDRIYLMGHSMGGGGTWHLGIKYPDIWAALAPIAPAVFRPAADVEKIKHIPVILVQGGKDTLTRPEGARRWAEQMKTLDMTHEYVEDPNADHGSVVAANLPKIFEFFNKHKRTNKNSK